MNFSNLRVSKQVSLTLIAFSVFINLCCEKEQIVPPTLSIFPGTTINVGFDEFVTFTWETNGVSVEVNGIPVATGTFTTPPLKTKTIYTVTAYAKDFSSNGLSTSLNVIIEVEPRDTELDIYIGGNDNGHLGYWKNDTMHVLDENAGWTGSIYDLAVDGINVYAVGNNSHNGLLWKNETSMTLTPNTSGTIRSVALENGNVHAVGYKSGNNPDNAMYWKNGTETILGKDLDAPTGCSVFIRNNDIYISGNLDGKPVFWKNGVLNKLPIEGSAGSTVSIILSGTDLYIAGTDEEKAVYWKNGVRKVLSNKPSEAKDMAILGSDVYIVGIEDHILPVIWKNGIKKVLSTKPEYVSHANAIAIDGNDIYVAGIMSINANSFPVYWKNDSVHFLPVYITGQATSIVLFRH